MRKIMLGLAVLSLTTVACKKTGEGEYEVQKPVIGTQTDTVRTPSLGTQTDTLNVITPKVSAETSQVVVKKPVVRKP